MISAVNYPLSWLIYFVCPCLQRQTWPGCSGSGDYVELLGGNGVDTSKMFPVADLCFSLSGLGKSGLSSVSSFSNRTVSGRIITIMTACYGIFNRSLLFSVCTYCFVRSRIIAFQLPVWCHSLKHHHIIREQCFKIAIAYCKSLKIITSHVAQVQISAMQIRHFLPFYITKAQIYSPLCWKPNPE